MLLKARGRRDLHSSGAFASKQQQALQEGAAGEQGVQGGLGDPDLGKGQLLEERHGGIASTMWEDESFEAGDGKVYFTGN
jgi:hypothetical protein